MLGAIKAAATMKATAKALMGWWQRRGNDSSDKEEVRCQRR